MNNPVDPTNIPAEDLLKVIELQAENKIRCWFSDGYQAYIFGADCNEDCPYDADNGRAVYWWKMGWNYSSICSHFVATTEKLVKHVDKAKNLTESIQLLHTELVKNKTEE